MTTNEEKPEETDQQSPAQVPQESPEEKKPSFLSSIVGGTESLASSAANSLFKKFAQPTRMDEHDSLLNRGSFFEKLKAKHEKEGEDRENLAFMNSVDAALHNTGHPMAYAVSVGVLLFFIIFFIWASFATLDEVARGEGSVVPAQRVQVIQNLEGGVLQKINVTEGQEVKKDQILAIIDNKGTEANVKDIQAKILEHDAKIARLEAETTGSPLVFSPKLVTEAPNVVANEKNVYSSRQAQFQQEEAAAQSLYEQRLLDVQEMEGRKKTCEASLNISMQKRNNVRPFVGRSVSRQDFLNLEQQVTDLQGQIEGLASSIPRARKAAQEAQERLNQRKTEIRNAALTELATARAELSTLDATLSGRADVLARTDVRSPVDGIVKKIYITTEGGVIKPAESIMEIVPKDDALLVEAKIRPSDKAFVKEGQDAMVKISTFDFSKYGGLEAKVIYIGADTLEDKKGEVYYQVKLRTKQNYILGLDRKSHLPISPGMVATVDILTDKKTVLDYLLKPIFKAKQDALIER